MNKKKRLRKVKKQWIVNTVFVIGFIVNALIVGTIWHSKVELQQDVTNLNAQNAIAELSTNVDKCIEDTEILELLLKQNEGKEIDDFDAVAAKLMNQKSYISSLQLAPNGIVDTIYPEKGNEAGKINLLTDEQRGKISNYSKDQGKVTIQGPFDLRQGG